MDREQARERLEQHLPKSVLASVEREDPDGWRVTLLTFGLCRSWHGSDLAEVVHRSLAAFDAWRADRSARGGVRAAEAAAEEAARRNGDGTPPRLSAPTSADVARNRRAKDAG